MKLDGVRLPDQYQLGLLSFLPWMKSGRPYPAFRIPNNCPLIGYPAGSGSTDNKTAALAD
jgi:hypothetical protein